MKASLIIPCWNSAATLPRTLACVRAQTCTDFEAIFVDDGSTDATPQLLAEAASADARLRVIVRPHRGVSATRNAGLDVAQGTFVFFADPDDAFDATMLEKGCAAMERAGADYCIFPYREVYVEKADSTRPPDDAFTVVPLKGACRYLSNDAIVREHLTRMFGFSFDHVRAWYAGTPIRAHRVQGSTCWCVYRRDLIERHQIRFDERITLYEDAMFNCAYMLVAQRMTCIDEPLYDYIHLRTGAIASQCQSGRELANKFELLRVRQELDARSGGRLTAAYAASCVFSLLEMLKIVLTRRAPFGEGLRQIRAYAAVPVVRRALAAFPLSPRKPVLAGAVCLLRLCFPAGDPSR